MWLLTEERVTQRGAHQIQQKALRDFAWHWREASVFMYLYRLMKIQLVWQFCSVKDMGKFSRISCVYLSEFSESRSMHWREDKPHTYELSCILIKQLRAIILHCTGS